MGNKNNDSRVSQKELLLFSNLTNLEWQFVNLDRDNEDEGKRSTKLRDLLTPKNFVRYDEEIDDYTYPYLKGKQGQNITLTDKERQEGRKEMVKYASVAMGYKEQEAEFLGNWEVVYAGDRYKVIRDFFDGLLKAKYEEEDSKDADNIPEPGDEDHPLSSREEVEENQNKKTQLKLFVNGISVAAKLAPLAIQLSCADEVFNLHKFADGIEDSLSSVDELTDQVAKKFINKQIGAGYKGLLEGSITSWSLFALKQGFDISQKSLKSDIKNINEEKQVKMDTDNMTEEEKQKIKEKKSSKLGFTKKLNLQAGTKEGDGFRVVVFKKDDQIVISYRADEDSNGETLPPDRDLLQLVYNRVYFNNCEGKKEGQKPEIRFVGLNAGADLGAVSSLLYEQPCSTFYTKNPRIKGYIDFTPDDLNSNYQNNTEIYKDSVETLALEGAIELTAGLLLSQGVLPGLILLAAVEFFDILKDFMEQKRIEEFYKKLQKSNIIEMPDLDLDNFFQDIPKVSNTGFNPQGNKKDSKERKLKGKITSVINDKDALKVNLGGDEVKVKMQDVFYIWLRDISNRFQKKSEGVYKAKYDEELVMQSSWGTGRTKIKECTLEKNTANIYEITKVEESKEGNFIEDKSTDITDKIFNISNWLYNTVIYIRNLQQGYLDNRANLQYIYPNLPDGSEVGQEKINIDEEIPQQVEYRPDISQHFFDKEDEYVFLPYINDGKKGKKGENKEGKLNTDGKLNKKYKCKVLASMIARVPNILDQTYYIKQSKVDDLEKSIEVKTIRIDHIEVDGDELKPEIIEDNYSEGCKLKCDFKNNSVEKALKQFLTYEDMCAAAFADFHYYKKVYDELEDLIKNHVRVKRKGPANSEIKLGKGDGKKYIGFDDIKSKLRIEGLNLPINKIGELKGSMHIDKGEPQTIKLKMDNQKKLKSEDYNNDSTIEINGKQIGQAKYIVDGVKEQVNDNNSDGLIVYENGKEKLCESTEDIVNLTQFNQKWTIEEYHETIEVEEKDKEDINIRYIHVYMPEDLSSIDSSASKPYLIIRYGHGERYDNVLKIKGFTYKRFDYGIYLPRGHKLKGSLNADVAVQKHKEFKF